MSAKAERAKLVNQLIRVIGENGRRFFQTNGFYACMYVSRFGHIYFVDDYSGARIYTHYKGSWKGFSHGGTLKSLVENFRDYIATGNKIPSGTLGPWPQHLCDGDLWGYGSDMEAVRSKAIELGIYPPAKPMAASNQREAG